MPEIKQTEKHTVKDGVEKHEVKYDAGRTTGEKIKDGVSHAADKVAEGAHKLGDKVSSHTHDSGCHGSGCTEKTKTTVEYK